MKSLRNLFGKAGDKSIQEKSHESHHNHEHMKDHGDQDKPGTKYYCPMHCEGDKTYDEPGNCPVCNMKLVPLK